MLDHNDKEWVEDLIDRKLEETKSDLRSEMQEMKTDLRSEMQEMSADIITQVTAVFENTKASQQIMKNESPN